ncbi:carboxylate-amine ligase [uncultured Roseibium sp.]|uniref:carboxylate-amine ligase n=1 Tax=uncultured Roseibium sp. TaxID=1936171 RepID=UPI002592C9D1|nr:carboxylate-amine ligase [uncultured Roseibium sp.]
MTERSFTLGIEEEYLLVDLETGDLASAPPKELFADCEEALEGRVSPEFLKCQIEVGTRVCSTMAEARAELAFLRRTIADKALHYGLAPIAASTHPFGDWMDQAHTNKDRYNVIADDMRTVVDRLLICGMHLHVGIEDDDLRFDLFNQLTYFLPHLLALSGSSPFWQGRKTGLKSYRLAAYNEMPRTGLPERFPNADAYRETVDVLVRTGVLEDATKIWWDLRPSDRFPTLEMRITDICPRLDDGIALAALFRCLCRMLARMRAQNLRWRDQSLFLIAENRWQAERHGVSAELIDFSRGQRIPMTALVEELIELVAEDADAFGSQAEIAHLRKIAQEGTSADRQLRTYETALSSGKSEREALKAVVAELVEETLATTEPEAHASAR